MQRLEDLTLSGPDQRPQAQGPRGRRQELHQDLVRKVQEDQGHLSHADATSTWYEPEVPNREVGSRLDMESIQLALRRATRAAAAPWRPSSTRCRPQESPPYLLRTTGFTNGFQALIKRVGVATYREANPAVTINHLPFLRRIVR